jgi:hypothetical protein
LSIVVDERKEYDKLEKTEGAITNGQSRDTGNIGNQIQNEDKYNKKHKTEN